MVDQGEVCRAAYRVSRGNNAIVVGMSEGLVEVSVSALALALPQNNNVKAQTDDTRRWAMPRQATRSRSLRG